MSSDAAYLWIKTRDGSPTLWSNDISEPFRSTKGAFSESWAAFVKPALDALRLQGLERVRVGEFGLGPGTNWLIWSVAARLMGIKSNYFVIEKETAYFEAGLKKWSQIAPDVVRFVVEAVQIDFGLTVDAELALRVTTELRELSFERPTIFSSIDMAVRDLAGSLLDIWFHDPFGFAVNPEGYSPQTLAMCQRLWAGHIAGFSYASNRQFRDALESLKAGITFKSCDTGNQSLKRNRSEFSGPLYPLTITLK